MLGADSDLHLDSSSSSEAPKEAEDLPFTAPDRESDQIPNFTQEESDLE